MDPSAAQENVKSTVGELMARDQPLTWLFTGDSVTQGARYTFGQRDYTQLFAERLRFECGRNRDVVINTAVSGRRVDDLAEDLDWSVLRHQPDVVSVMLGLNDAHHGPAALPAFRATYNAVLDRIGDLQPALVLVHTPNRILPTEEPRRVEYLPLYVEAIRDLTHDRRLPLVDNYAEWWPSEESDVMHNWIGHGCHPNAYGHRMLAGTLARFLGIWDESSPTCRLLVP